MSSESTGTNSLPGVDGAAPSKGVKFDVLSTISSNSAASSYGPGSSDGGSGISSISREIDNKRAESKSFWRKFKKK